ncbi:carbohydrate ABC transporter permease [Salsuginibacillus kocurii]|uniref:carbohydrate ABC transporter permease n=1 Tax=Salsuginibacillus kocurii TaxID=427078 RepID=UPI00036CD5A0|nr:sugar ABC transporter permease [Salsuginibacillus kocurii]
MNSSLSTPSQQIPPEKKGNKFTSFFNSKKVAPYVFVVPFILSFLILYLYPFVYAIIMSFQQVLPGQTEFIGLQNYERLMNPTFYRAVFNTTIYVICTVIILVVVPLLLAVLLNSRLTKLKILFRTAFFMPALTSVIVAGVIFNMIFSESDSAAANQVLAWIGLDSVDWQYNAVTGMFLMVALASWRWIGVNIMYFLAALQNISDDLYEAADIDGANAFQKFYYVTLPALKPIVIFVSTITIINGFRMFEESFVFWETSSPGNIGLTVVGYIYQAGIQQNDMGFGAAIGVFLMIIILVVSLIQLKFFGAFKKDE